MSVHDKAGILWDDLRVTANMMSVAGAQFSRPPCYVPILTNEQRGPSFSGLYGYQFGYGRGVFQSGHFQVQIPHGYVPGTPIEPHVHVRLDPASEGAAGQKLLLEFEYVWVNLGGQRPESTRIVSMNHEVTEQNLRQDNVMISFGFIEKADAGISSMLDCRFSRITFDPDWGRDFWSPQGLENDTFQGNLIFKEFDFHYQIDSLGSREPGHK
ncbi:MAG: hypothetical protein JXB06_02470 [Spirochaetales bacterium]|nr:hypothetical protein [Spirochaetales bacterium]